MKSVIKKRQLIPRRNIPEDITRERVQLPTSADNVALPAFTAARRAAARLLLSAGQQSVDISCSLDPQQQTRSGGRMGQTDRQTDGHRIVT